MGRPKLLIELQGETLIHRVVTALHDGGADRVIVVPPADGPEAAEIAREAAAAGAEVVVPETQPAEMRDSVELGLSVLDDGQPPSSVLLTPGDVPGITPELVARLLQVAAEWPDRVVIPTHGGDRGHPIVVPWRLALEVRHLPDDAGVNTLINQQGDDVIEVAIEAPGTIGDVDTPEQLESWSRGMHGTRSAPDAWMTVRVRLFALARERCGRSEIAVELREPATVGDLRAALRSGFAELGPLAAGALVAVDEEYAGDAVPLSSASRIALIPPVSGGGESLPGACG